MCLVQFKYDYRTNQTTYVQSEWLAVSLVICISEYKLPNYVLISPTAGVVASHKDVVVSFVEELGCENLR